MLVNMTDMLADAAKGGYAVGAFNFSTLEYGMAAIRASEELGIPFVLQHAPAHEGYVPLEVAGPIMLDLARRAKTPVAVHLDHGTDFALCKRALELGFTSVMIDSSALPFAENVELAAAVVREARRTGASVEAELGSMPNNFNGELGDYRPEDFYTKPDDAADYVAKTGIDALAISFGTVHGVYKAVPKLDFGVIDAVRQATGGLPLVMHGGSGLSAVDYHEAIRRGIRKINYYTYGALAGGRAVCELVREKPDGLQFHDVAVRAAAAICDDIKHVMRCFSLQDGGNPRLP